MPQTRPGLFQAGCASISWPIRSSLEIIGIFQQAYTRLRGEDVIELVSSLDAIHVRPPIKPFASPKTPDWAHFDQTLSENVFECVQGQVVLTNTTGSFCCSPKSHLVFAEFLKKHKKLGSPADWFMLPGPLYEGLKQTIQDVGGEWQIPVVAPQGSVILWLSSTLHSAVAIDKKSAIKKVDPTDPWNQWRCTFYVCHRPKKEVLPEHLERLQEAFKFNRTTNHWGTKLFPTSLPNRFMVPSHYDQNIQEYIKQPKLILDLEGFEKPEETKWVHRLLGRGDWDKPDS